MLQNIASGRWASPMHAIHHFCRRNSHKRGLRCFRAIMRQMHSAGNEGCGQEERGEESRGNTYTYGIVHDGLSCLVGVHAEYQRAV